MEEKNVIRALAALAQSMRLQIFRLLVVGGKTGLTPGAIAEALQVPPTTLSFHLKELTNSGLVTQQRDGRHLIHHASFEHMNTLLSYLTENCCQGESCLTNTATSCNC